MDGMQEVPSLLITKLDGKKKRNTVIMDTRPHNYFPEPLDESKEVQYLLAPLMSSLAENKQTGHQNIVTFVKSIRPVLQRGPMCGLVALTMASELLSMHSSDSRTHPDCILEYARHSRLTKQGEMFSAQYVKQIGTEYLSLKTDVLPTDNLTKTELIQLLLSPTQAVLVPYDADKNHTPSLEEGHKAHWCILTGLAVSLRQISERGHIKLQCYTEQAREGHLVLRDSSAQEFIDMLLSGELQINRLHVFARHGKSRHMGLWSWEELKRSNKNLFEVDPHRTLPGEYVIPEPGGIKEGLRSQIILLSNS